ncbi:hypothetical protein ABW21_db0209450 [Orbilia brochopaga]|nr:hypothetical protein ABW21_db0209450 [Drechslerella brochopaga]
MKNRYKAEDYKYGWICAIPLELAAAVAVLDKRHPEQPRPDSDPNTYQFGEIGHTNVIITALPAGVYGTVSAAIVATNLRRSFPSVTNCLMVGIGGGAPLLPHNDIRLGDVVISRPVPGYGGVLQYDYGKTVQEGNFVQTGVLNKPPRIFLQAVAKLEAESQLDNNATLERILAEALKDETISEKFGRPTAENDRLFESCYDHPAENDSCDRCDSSMVVERAPRSRDKGQIRIHYGLIASGNQVMKHGATRNKLSRESNILCFEMEAAGLMDVDDLPCLVVRGICDYSDSHKNKIWQPYAALVAAAYAKTLLLQLPPSEDKATDRKLPTNGQTKEERYKCLRGLGGTNPHDDKIRIQRSKDELLVESLAWIFSVPSFQEWLSGEPRKPILWLSGGPGKGKTMMSIAIIDFLEDRQANADNTGDSMAISYFFCQAADNRLNESVNILKGLLYRLIDRYPSQHFYKHVKEEVGKGGSGGFSGKNTIYALERVLLTILSDPTLPELYFVIDALDECEQGLENLIDIISRTVVNEGSRIRWLFTSRNRPDIEERLENDAYIGRISLEDNDTAISHGVNIYINSKVADLAQRKRYSASLREEMTKTLQLRAGKTFLWVHLACKELLKVKGYQALSRLQQMPSGLNEFYHSMLAQIEKFSEGEDFTLCSEILLAITVARMPVNLSALRAIAAMPAEMSKEELERQIRECGSFLVVEAQRISLVHQSAKDFLEAQIGSKLSVAQSLTEQHRRIAYRCIDQMHKELKMDSCELSHQELFKSAKAKVFRYPWYACVCWIYHLEAVGIVEDDEALIFAFLQEHFLHWVEAMAALRAPSEIILTLVQSLESMVKAYRIFFAMLSGLLIFITIC